MPLGESFVAVFQEQKWRAGKLWSTDWRRTCLREIHALAPFDPITSCARWRRWFYVFYRKVSNSFQLHMRTSECRYKGIFLINWPHQMYILISASRLGLLHNAPYPPNSAYAPRYTEINAKATSLHETAKGRKTLTDLLPMYHKHRSWDRPLRVVRRTMFLYVVAWSTLFSELCFAKLIRRSKYLSSWP